MRQLGMLAAVGATDKQTRLVMIANGIVVGAVAAAVGLTAASVAWVVTRPSLERLFGHEMPVLGAPPWVVVTGVALAVVTSTLAAWWPARSTTRVPVVVALSGRPPQPTSPHRSLLPAAVLLAGGVFAAGAGVNVKSGSANPFLLIGGALAVVGGVLLLAPLAIRGAATAARRAPLAVRLALRDLSRYQSRSAAALAAISLGLGIAVTTVVIASAAENTASEGNLAANQMLIRGRGDSLMPDQFAQTAGAVDSFAGEVKGTTVYGLDGVFHVNQMAAGKDGGDVLPPMSLARRINPRTSRFLTQLYVATPELLARAGLTDDASVDAYAVHAGQFRFEPLGRDAPIPRVGRYDAPEFASVPTALVTPAGMARYGFERLPVGWFLEADRPFTSAEVGAARDMAADAGLFVEVRDAQGGLFATRAIATAVGAFVALCLLALTIGLIRSEAGRDVQTLVAAGATSFTRRALTAATSGALALLGSILAIAGSYVALIAIYFDRPSDLSGVPFVELSTLLFGLPIVAAAAGWLVPGREPAVITRHVLD
jgi:putative ABC transport system permease protein